MDGTVSDEFADVHELFNDCIGFLRGATFASLIDGCLIVTFVLLLFEELFDGLRVIDIDRADLEDVDNAPQDREEGAREDEVVRPFAHHVIVDALGLRRAGVCHECVT